MSNNIKNPSILGLHCRRLACILVSPLLPWIHAEKIVLLAHFSLDMNVLRAILLRVSLLHGADQRVAKPILSLR